MHTVKRLCIKTHKASQLERGKCFIGARAVYCLIQIAERERAKAAARHVVQRSPCVFVLFILFTPSPIYYGPRIKIRGEMRKDDFYCIKRVPRRAEKVGAAAHLRASAHRKS